MDNKAVEELKFCLKLWEKQGYCEFGKKTNCKDCGAPYVLWKMVSGEIIHGPNYKRLSLDEWKNKIKDY